jgi:hypothetical protein
LAWSVQLAAAAEQTLLDGSRIINVVRIGHRSDVYRN